MRLSVFDNIKYRVIDKFDKSSASVLKNHLKESRFDEVMLKKGDTPTH